MDKNPGIDMDSLDAKQAKQRASVKWILSKAFNNRVPENLREPFYRDHEGQEHLKPQIVVDLGNASLYCQTLSNLHSDPNYQSLNHWSILQMLTRKGVPVGDSTETPLTETVLIQTNPLRINAHMTVIEALMILYAKEVASGDRVSSTLRRISGGSLPSTVQNHEDALLHWISHVCASLRKRIDQEVETGGTDEAGARIRPPDMPPLRDYRDLCDGVCLAFLIAYYCPKVVPWTSVIVNYLPTVEDSIHNVLLVCNFSQKHLPYSVFHMTPEDITYMRGSMKQNLVVLLADLFNLFEIHPAKCVCYPGMDQMGAGVADRFTSNEHGIAHRRGVTCQPVMPIPDLRSGLDSPTNSASGGRPPFQVVRSPSASTVRRQSPKDQNLQQHQQQHQQPTPSHAQEVQPQMDDGFVVHRSKGIPTLSSMHEPLVPARLRQAKEKTNNDSKSEERGDALPAGRPSNWEDARRPSFAGRRSRRNSFSEDSQLTIENFGGSQDQINMIGRVSVERERKVSNSSMTQVFTAEPTIAVRSSIQDARSTLQLGYDTDSGSEKQDKETEKTTLRRQISVDNVSLRNVVHSKEKELIETDNTQLNRTNSHTSPPIYDADESIVKRKTSFSTLPTTTTTWQQQSAANLQQLDNQGIDLYAAEESRTLVDASKLSTIRLKLEEKRRHIEQEKRKMEVALSKQQQKVGKAAFLQAINKGKKKCTESAGAGGNNGVSGGGNDIQAVLVKSTENEKAERPCSLQDITSDVNTIEARWDGQIESKRTPDLDQMDLDQYHQNIALMNTNLHDIQADIQRLANQQNQIHAQHIQAQQLMQAQQIANMINQYGSQHNIPGSYRPIVQNFGSTPHLSQQPYPPQSQSPYSMRPSSRDPHQSSPQPPLQIHQMQPQQIQFINDQGQYVSQQSNQQQQHLNHQQQQHQHQQHQHQQHQQQQHIVNSQSTMYGSRPGSVDIHSQYISDNGHYNVYGGGSNMYASQPYMEPTPSNHHQHSYMSPVQVPDPNHYRDRFSQERDSPQSSQFYLHDNSPTPPARRTWAQSAVSSNSSTNLPLDISAWSQNAPKTIDTRTWKSPAQNSGMTNVDSGSSGSSVSGSRAGSAGGGGFMLHQNGGGGGGAGGTPKNNNFDSQDHQDHQSYQNLFSVHSSPQHSRVQRQISQMINNSNEPKDNNRMPLSPPIDDMAPQSISFIGDEDSVEQPIVRKTVPARPVRHQDNDTALDISLGKLNITSGNRTYRIPSPTRPVLDPRSFQDPQDDCNEKGFYISFDNEQPKRPKPPLRTKRSPKKDPLQSDGSMLNNRRDSDKDRSVEKRTNVENNSFDELDEPMVVNKRNVADVFADRRQYGNTDNMNQQQINNNMTMDRRHLEDLTNYSTNSGTATYKMNMNENNASRQVRENKAIIIGGTEATDPNSVDEMERKKEKIMLLSLQRRQQQEEEKARKEIDSMQRREREREKEDERIRKREEQMARRAAILEAHKLKKAIEEAEREGKTLDKADMLMMKQHSMSAGQAKMRPQKITRPRPKTIHVESGSVDLSDASSSLASRGKKGSSSNLTGIDSLSSVSMRRDYYRGSQDSLAIRESPDEYPSTSSTPLGRRGSYKTAREPTIERGRTLSRISVPKGIGANFRGRKSNSLMNLCDTDSGLGRATPPRRAPSPGMGPSSRHLPSPSGPGSLPPGLMTKRRVFDDGSSDISTASSMMEYNGPKLYKQPAAKSNRGIILNAVEYCVFPGVVNRDAKQKVLEKIARSDAKHFLVLFRDAGCQFRALYSYWPENETIIKLYGTGPSQVDDLMFDKFFKYNSGGKCFSQVHTKHLTVTIDAFTIHNSLWQGKKVNLPSKKDMALVI